MDEKPDYFTGNTVVTFLSQKMIEGWCILRDRGKQ